MESQKINNLLGTKFYKEIEEKKFKVIRIIETKADINRVVVVDEEDNKEELNLDEVIKEYIRLVPDGLLMANTVTVTVDPKTAKTTTDVIIAIYTKQSMKTESLVPAALCRQSITDIFYATAYGKSDYVGMSISEKTCPPHIAYGMMLACDGIEYSIGCNYYIQDTVEDILNIMGGKLKPINDVMESNFKIALQQFNRPDMGQKKCMGWCRDIKTLVEDNMFDYDYNDAYNILPMSVKLEDHIILNEDDPVSKHYTFDEEYMQAYSRIYKIHIVKTIIIDYDHDIDLDKLLGKYFLTRSNTGKLYVVKYITEGEFLEKDLETLAAREAMEKVQYRDKYKV